MHGSPIPVLVSFAISFVVVFGGEVPASQVAGLHALFNSTNGVGWLWEPNETAYGVPWDFSNETVDPCIDHWQGISCSSVCDQASVCNIVGLSLAAYNLVGSLPQSVDLLSSLETLDLSSNTLVGQVPSTLGSLVQLQALDLSDNQLSGPVLDSLTSLLRLTSLVIESNCFSGSLPSDLFLMSSLVGLYVRNNKIGGTIPESLGRLVSLTGLDLFVNAVGGTLPVALGNLTALAYLDFYTNLMTGSVPASFSSLSSLTFLSFGNNQFTGTVPSYLGAFSSLAVLGVSYNSFQGAMPASFAALQGLKFFSCRDNLMTGDMGFMLALPLLQLYLAGNNFFTGDLGALASASVSPHLATLRMENNLLTGSALLPGLCADNSLKELVLSQNLLSGSVPPCISSWVNMTTIDLSANKLSGSLPTAIAQLKKLAAADVSTNHLHGQLVALFNNLLVLSVSDNEFTGPLPLNTFNSTRLQTFIASKNCFSGTLSPGICAAASLQTLALSGLMSAANCRVHLPFKRFTIEFFRGGIPPCIFEMPLLEQLFLSGNLIQGKLPELASGSLLHNISLGYNRLSGTIPRSVLTQPFLTILDLSYNRMLGTIEAMQNSTLDSERQLTLLLQENALSGNIPDQFHHSNADLNILSGNMFSCTNTAELPDSDPKSEKYSCGSDLLNTAVTITGAAWGLIIGIAVWLWFRTKQADGVGEYSFVALIRRLYGQFSKFSPNLDAMEEPELTLRHNLAVIRNFCLFVSLVTFFVLVVVLPVLTSYSLDPKFSVQTYQYGWVISLSFIQGVSPGIAIMILWVGLVLLCMAYELKCHDRKRPLPPNSPHRSRAGSELSDIDFDERSSSYNEVLLQKILIVGVSVSVSSLINVMYVYTVLYESFDVQTLALSALVVCKLAWMYLVVIPWLKQVNSQFLLILAVMVANVIVIPMIATLAVDDSCFYQYLHNGHAITTEYSYEICDLYDDDLSCISYSAKSNAVTIAAPIVYSYECFSAMLLIYVPMYLVTYGAFGIFGPVLQVAICLFFADAGIVGDQWRLDRIRALKSRWWFPFHYLFPITCAADLLLATDKGSLGDESRQKAEGAESRLPRSNFYLSKYKALNCVLSLVIMLTFGFCYAPLAIVMLVNIFATMGAYRTCIHVHSMQLTRLPAECQRLWVAILRRETELLQKIMYGCRTLVYLICGGFACLAGNDIVGVVDRSAASVLVIVVLVVSVVANRLFAYHGTRLHVESSELRSLEQEMPTFGVADVVSTENPIHMGVSKHL